MWEREPTLPAAIDDDWKNGKSVRDLGDIATNLHGVMASLKRWSKDKFGAVTQELENLHKKLEDLNELGNRCANDEEKAIQNQMDELLYREETMWLQRSHITWLKEVDRNTKFFHRKTAIRAKKILLRGYGRRMTKPHKIKMRWSL
jgi:hypothetical protein